MPPRAIFRKDNHWYCITQPEVLVARNASAVLPLLADVEAATARGLTAAGFVSYEAASAFDPALCHHDADPDVPLALFLVGSTASTHLPAPAAGIRLQETLDQQTFEARIARIKAYLREGDTYQVNFTHRHEGTLQADAEAVFARLYAAQPSPLATCLQFEDLAVCSVSPELFFELADGEIRCEPMKGTRPRGRYSAEDELIRQSLRSSVKDRAENLMIVDMIRNDLGRIATPGTVNAADLFTIRRLPTVWQQVSEVTARTGAGLPGIFQALFPCASITGAPKTRTMQIIRELEDGPRGIYTGALGIVEPGGRARFSVGIRTLTMVSGRASYGVGGGIVWDSDPAEEWQESLIKAKVLNYRLPEFELLETMLAEKDAGVRHLEQHLARLAASADYFGYPFDGQAIRTRLAEQLANETVRVRLVLGREGAISVATGPVPETVRPVRLKLASEPVSSDNVFVYHKTTHREVYEQALAAVDGCDDVLLFNERGELTETTIFNLIVELDGNWYTPPVSSGLLAGTCRGQLLTQGRVQEKVLTRQDLYRATRVLVCNSLRGVLEAAILEPGTADQYSLGGRPL